MPEMISIACDICGQPYRREVNDLGKKAKCKVCGTTFKIVQQVDPDELFDSEEASESNPLPWMKGGMTSALLVLIIVGLGSLLFLPTRQRVQSGQAQRPVARSDKNLIVQRQEAAELQGQAKSLLELEPTVKVPEKVLPKEVPTAVEVKTEGAQEFPLQQIVNDVLKERRLVPFKSVPVKPAKTPVVTSSGPTRPVSVGSSGRPVDRDLSDRYQLVETSGSTFGGRVMHGIPMPSAGPTLHGNPLFPTDFSHQPGMSSAAQRSRALHQSFRDRIRQQSGSSLRNRDPATNGNAPQNP